MFSVTLPQGRSGMPLLNQRSFSSSTFARSNQLGSVSSALEPLAAKLNAGLPQAAAGFNPKSASD
jgi:hypothetical protein